MKTWWIVLQILPLTYPIRCCHFIISFSMWLSPNILLSLLNSGGLFYLPAWILSCHYHLCLCICVMYVWKGISVPQQMCRGQRTIWWKQFLPSTSGFRVKHLWPLTHMSGPTDYFLNALNIFVSLLIWDFNIGLPCSFKMDFVNEQMHGTWSPHGVE